MGNSASGDKGRYRHGYHVLMVKENTPAARAGLRPYFDYIMGINGIRLNKEDSVLRDQMESSEDRPVILDIYSTREQALRKIELTPVHKWDNGKDGYIGCSIRFCLFDTISDVVWHILDVASGSPAMEAGLCAHADYVIGTPLGIMRGEQDLYDLIEDYIADELLLHVYNANTNEVREVIIIPREDWGGQGLLGCDVGFGYLHRLPKQDHTGRQTNGSRDVKEKAHTAFVNTEKPVHKKTPIFQEKQQLETSSDEHAAQKTIQEHMATEKSTYHHQGVHDGNNNTDTQGSGNYEMTAPTPQPTQLDTTVSTDERPVPEPAANHGDDDEEVTKVTITELASPKQAGTVMTETAEPAQSAETVATPITLTGNNKTNTIATGTDEKEEESRNNESLSTPAEKEVSSKSDVSETRISSEQPIDAEKTPDLVKIDTTETPSSHAQQQQQQEQQHRPQAIAARMKPGIHGRGSFSAGIGGGRGRIGHDGFLRNGGISLQDVQAQAQQESSEYREEKKKKLEKEERMSASNASLNVQVLDNDDDSDNDDGSCSEKKRGVRGERRGRRRTKEEMDADFHEIVVEGMIRNMSLGSSIFPL